MNLGYWFEQIKLTTASAATLAAPVLPSKPPAVGPRFFPMVASAKRR